MSVNTWLKLFILYFMTLLVLNEIINSTNGIRSIKLLLLIDVSIEIDRYLFNALVIIQKP